jgi:hypothetical protein
MPDGGPELIVILNAIREKSDDGPGGWRWRRGCGTMGETTRPPP